MRRPPRDRTLSTVLFTDIVGSTDIAAELGDPRWRELLRRHHALVRGALKRFGGREVDTAGDGFFATFAEPAQAVRCACAIGDAVRELGIEVRAGVHTGEVEPMGKKVGGMAVHLASRVLSAASAGEVLVSSTTKDLVVGSVLHFADRGTHQLKGVPGDWRLYSVAAVDGEVRGPPLKEEDAAGRRESLRAPPLLKRRPGRVGIAVAGVAVLTAIVILALSRDGQIEQAPPDPGPTGPPRNSAVAIDPTSGDVLLTVEGITASQNLSNPTMAVGEGGVWVYSFPSLLHIDPLNGRIRSKVQTVYAFAGAGFDVVVGFQSVWVLGGSIGEEGILYRYNPATDEELKAVEFGSRGPAISVVVGEKTVWAGFVDGTVLPIDPRTLRIGKPIEVDGSVDALAVGGGAVWVMDQLADTVWRIDPETGDVSAPIPLNSRLDDIAGDENGVWILDGSAGTVTPIDADEDSPGAPIGVGEDPSDIAVGLGAVWVANQGDGTVSRIDPLTGDVTTIPIGAPVAAIAVDEANGTLWLIIAVEP